MDINDAVKAGHSVSDLMDAAETKTPILGADHGAQLAEASKVLSDLQELVAQTDDRMERNRFITAAAGNEKERRQLAFVYHYRKAEFEGACAVMSGMHGSAAAVKAMTTAVKSEALGISDQQKKEVSNDRAQTLGNLLEGLTKDPLKAPPGWVVTSTGVEKDGEVIMRMPVVITHRSRDLDTGKIYSKLAWRDEAWVERLVERGTAMSSRLLVGLADYGAPFNSNNASAAVKYLEEFEFHNDLDIEQSIGRMGWVGDSSFVVGEECIGDPVLVNPLPGEAQKMRGYATAGSWEGWCKVVEEFAADRKPVMCAIYASLASALLRPLNRKGFCVDWAGETSVGKTKSLEAAASCWGVPSVNEGIIGSWSAASTAGLFRGAWVCNSIPVLLDDTKEVRAAAIVSKCLYSIPQGEDTTRSNRDGSLQENKQWRTVMLTTGEAPITSFDKNHGAKARAIIIDDPPFGAPSIRNKNAADNFADGLLDNYGWAGRMFVERVMSHSAESWQRRYDEIKAEHQAKASQLGADNVLMRLVDHAAVVALAAQELEAMGLCVDPTPHIEYLLHRAVGEGGAAEEHDMPRAALDALFTWAAANEMSFWHRSGLASTRPSGGEWLGRWDAGEDWDRIGFDQSKAQKVLEAQGFDFKSVRLSWKKRGWMVTNKNGGNPNYGPQSSRLMVITREAIVG